MFVKHDNFSKHVKSLDDSQSQELACLAKREATDLAVLTLLAHQAYSTLELAKRSGLNPFRVAFALRRLQALGLVWPYVDEKRPGRRIWCLSGLGAEAAHEVAADLAA